MKNSSLNNNRGVTITEVLVATLILGIIAAASFTQMDQLFRVQLKVSRGIDRQQILATIIEGIKVDSASYQKNFKGVDLAQVSVSELPTGYTNDSGLVTRDKCPASGCSVYVGFVIQSMPNLPGLYVADVRMVAPGSNGSGDVSTTYHFITTAK